MNTREWCQLTFWKEATAKGQMMLMKWRHSERLTPLYLSPLSTPTCPLCSQYLLCGLPPVTLDKRGLGGWLIINNQSATASPVSCYQLVSMPLLKRPSAPFMCDSGSDLHVRSKEMLQRGVRRPPNMTNDWLRKVFDCSAACWHFTNGSDSTTARVFVCVCMCVCVV